jgi:hypothetical protein
VVEDGFARNPLTPWNPENRASGFGLKPNWPGLALLVALGAALLLAGVTI